MMIFKDRQSAGKLLAERLKKYKNNKKTLILAIPRGGVVVGKKIAKSLKLPLDVIITRKIGAPMQPELALGAISPKGEVFWDEDLLKSLSLSKEELENELNTQIEEIKRREEVFRGIKSKLDLKNEIIILVDDGIATGATTLSAIKYLKTEGAKKIILAVPVVAKDIADKLEKEVDELVALQIPTYLGAVGSFYQNFEQVSDEQVLELLS